MVLLFYYLSTNFFYFIMLETPQNNMNDTVSVSIKVMAKEKMNQVLNGFNLSSFNDHFVD